MLVFLLSGFCLGYYTKKDYSTILSGVNNNLSQNVNILAQL